ncbi:aminotransferase class V-fold PLP-dependent enzyme [Deinococcus radiophilus]|uniref:O-acetylhomoserine aminocarboxypropyltransferase/cysteine synthase n=2 Tax=Deinococcus radiophilus TaxID=32062 RepID=A0A3S0L3Z6_9DEIO|nr:aminotransferase class V-fold PLP-dependent enzyme [Deinococcus radiophilus]RTR26520.1 O-acetylhomoserine aminocarboxypropyltransferase/cysteine synthase [Deinococcus radiophilus]
MHYSEAMGHDEAPTIPPWDYSTRAVQSAIPRGLGQSIGFPVHAAAAFQFTSLEEAQQEFIQGGGLSYARLQNPTVRMLEERINSLEGADHTLAVASGQSATFTALMSVCRAGDHIVSAPTLFGGSVGLLQNVLPLMGIETTFTDGSPEGMRAAIQPNTRLLWAEMISNPSGDVADIELLAEIAHDAGILLAIDNTVGAAGYLIQPLAHGADMSVQSLTKWAGGHGSVMGGSVSVNATRELSANPMFTEGGEHSLLGLHGDRVLAVRQRWLGGSQLGMTLAPHSAFLLAQGLETVGVRLDRECVTAQTLAEWLSSHPKVSSVSYCGLPDHPSYETAQKYLPRGKGAIMTFDVPDPARFLEGLQLLRIAPNLGDTRTLVVHPWTTTHGRVPEARREAAGVRPGTIRMTVGLEDVQDLMADIDQAL